MDNFRCSPHMRAIIEYILPIWPEFHHCDGFSGVSVTRYLVFCVMFHQSLLVLLFILFWLLCCLFLAIVLSVLGYCVVCSWLLCFLFLAIVLSVLDYCVVCSWLLCCLFLTIVLSVLGYCVVCSSLVYGI